jgi:hypothetical protein
MIRLTFDEVHILLEIRRMNDEGPVCKLMEKLVLEADIVCEEIQEEPAPKLEDHIEAARLLAEAMPKTPFKGFTGFCFSGNRTPYCDHCGKKLPAEGVQQCEAYQKTKILPGPGHGPLLPSLPVEEPGAPT